MEKIIPTIDTSKKRNPRGDPWENGRGSKKYLHDES